MNIKVTPEKMQAFCAALATTGIVKRACDAISISRQTAYEWRESQKGFAAAWDKALRIGIGELEDEAHRRAFEGYDKPIVHQGVVTTTVKEYSDTLAIFLLKAHDPGKYRENSRMELTGADGGPLKIDDTMRASRVAALLKLAGDRKADTAALDDLI